MTIQVELILIVLSVLFFFSILAGKVSSKFGIPALLLFLAVGMISGSDGLGIQFENIHIAQTIGTLALCIILFSGGLDTKINEIRPIIAQGVVLATFGVLLTALIAGLIIWFILGFTNETLEISFITSLLLAATMSSTDSASVFSILRSKSLSLKNNLRPMLELESGSNDPMAFILVITFIDVIKIGNNLNYFWVGIQLIFQLLIGALIGYVVGKFAIFIINRIKIGNDSLYPILVFTFCIFIFSITYYAKGNGYLAVYIGGLVLGNAKFVHKRSSLNFFDGLAWMSQLLMFLTLGLLVNPRELLPILIPGIIISLSIIFIARPLSVFISLSPFRKMSFKDKSYISWVGLRGAVPIIFAIIPLAEEIPNARIIFNIVFLSTLVSLIIQGTSLSILANWLGLAKESPKIKKMQNFDVDFSNDIKSITTEIEITEAILSKGNKLMDLALPMGTLAVLVKRDENYFIPKGNTILEPNDKLLIITDNTDTLLETYKGLGIEES